MRARTGASGEAPACTSCGACCFSREPGYIQVFEVDVARMGPRARSFVDDAPQPRLRFEGGRCAALVLDGAEGAYACSIYEERPDVCRSLARGSGDCGAQRAEKRLLSIATLLRTRRRSG